MQHLLDSQSVLKYRGCLGRRATVWVVPSGRKRTRWSQNQGLLKIENPGLSQKIQNHSRYFLNTSDLYLSYCQCYLEEVSHTNSCHQSRLLPRNPPRDRRQSLHPRLLVLKLNSYSPIWMCLVSLVNLLVVVRKAKRLRDHH